MAMARKMLALNMIIVALGVLMMAQETMQMSMRNPLRSVIDRINDNVFQSYYLIALIFPSDKNEKAFLETGAFRPNQYNPYVDYAGRRYHIGRVGSKAVIYVKSGKSSTNAVMSLQIMLDYFPIRGVVHFGSAGGLHPGLNIGDVAIFSSVADTGSWTWKKYGSTGHLNIRRYNTPEGENLLGSIDYESVIRYFPPNSFEKIFWHRVDFNYLRVAAKLKNMELQRCVTAGNCLPTEPKIVYGLNGTSSGVYIKNAAYRSFMYKTLNAATADTESADVAWTCSSNELPFIIFRGISNKAGSETKQESLAYSNADYGYLASVNAALASIAFINSLPSPRAE